MAKRPYVSFAEVKEKVPIPDALTALGIAERFARKGDHLSGICPLPGHKHGPSPNPEQFKINRRDGVWLWHCFGDCQRGGDVVELVKLVTGHDDAHVRFWFAERFGDRLSLGKSNGKQPVETDTARGDLGQGDRTQAASLSNRILSTDEPALKPLRFFLNLDPDVPYLEQRGVKPETIQRFGLGLCGKGVLKGYVAIPVYGCSQTDAVNPVAYLGRWPGEDYDETDGRPRYKWPEGFPKSQVVYGLREALDGTDSQALIVVEGPFKVYHLLQQGFPGAVAIFGSSLSDGQAAILAASGRPIVLMFDGNEAGQNGMRSAAGKLITRTYVRVVKLAEGQEPDQLSTAELRQLLT
jgi:DNA primase